MLCIQSRTTFLTIVSKPASLFIVLIPFVRFVVYQLRFSNIPFLSLVDHVRFIAEHSDVVVTYNPYLLVLTYQLNMKRDQSSELSILKKGHRVEVRSDEEGLTGTLFPAIIVQKFGKGNGFLVEYRDLMTDDGKSKLRETVQSDHVRPEPPALNRKCFFLHEEVDAYDRDGWWKGVVHGVLPHNRYVVYFSQTNENCEYSIKQLRLRQDWIHGKWVSGSETVELKESNPESMLFSNKNVEHIPSKSVRRSTNGNKKRSVAKVLKLSGECKADDQSGTLQAGGSQLTQKHCKRKQGAEDLSNNSSAYKRKMPSKKDVDVTEVQDEENIPKPDAMGVKRDVDIDRGSPAKSDTIAISIPYLEYVDQNICSPGDTPGIRGKATLKQIQLLAYHSVLKALYLQKTLDWKHQILLTDLRDVLHISSEEHAKELRRITSTE